MDERQIELVEKSFARAARIGPQIAATFYAELFVVEPALRAMFKGDMVAQCTKVMRTLEYLVAGLRTPETILPAVRALAVRHVDYGVEPHHYPHAGTALMRTLKHELGPSLDAETRGAWAAAYQFVAKEMLEAAYGVTPGPVR